MGVLPRDLSLGAASAIVSEGPTETARPRSASKPMRFASHLAPSGADFASTASTRNPFQRATRSTPSSNSRESAWYPNSVKRDDVSRARRMVRNMSASIGHTAQETESVWHQSDAGESKKARSRGRGGEGELLTPYSGGGWRGVAPLTVFRSTSRTTSGGHPPALTSASRRVRSSSARAVISSEIVPASTAD